MWRDRPLPVTAGAVLAAAIVEGVRRAGVPVKMADVVMLSLCQLGFTTPESKETMEGRSCAQVLRTTLARDAGRA